MSHFGHPPNVQLNRPAPNAVFTRDSNNPFGRAQLVIRSQVCIPVASQRNLTGMGQWCQENCLKYPPNTMQQLKMGIKGESGMVCNRN